MLETQRSLDLKSGNLSIIQGELTDYEKIKGAHTRNRVIETRWQSRSHTRLRNLDAIV